MYHSGITLIPDGYENRTTLYVNELFPNAHAMFDEITYPQYQKDGDSTVDNLRDSWNMVLEEMVYRHYEMRQIAHETPARFLKRLSVKMNEIMPRYYRLQTSDGLITPENALVNYDLTETYVETSENTAQSDSNGARSYDLDSGETLDDTQKALDTPEGQISNIETYLSGAAKRNTQTTGNQHSDQDDENHNTASGNSERNYTLNRKGNIGIRTFAQDLKEYRTTFLEIERMVIADLAPLFLGVY